MALTPATQDDIALSRQIGHLEGLVAGIDRAITELRTQVATEHGKVDQRLGDVLNKLDSKAPAERVNDHAERLRLLEQGAAEGTMATRIIRFSYGAGTLVLAALTYLAGRGSL